MASVKIDTDELEKCIDKLSFNYKLAFDIKNPMTQLEKSGIGKMQDELENYNIINNLLFEDLAKMYTDIESFLTRIKDETILADEYGASQILMSTRQGEKP